MKRTNTNNHMARLDLLASMLKSEDLLIVNDLAQHLGVSTRTLYRDINLLRERGLPIDADRGRGGGVRLHRSWGLGKLNVTDQETVDLLISLAVSEKMNSPLFMNSLASIRFKLMALLSSDQKLKIKTLRGRIRIGSSASPLVLSSYEIAPFKNQSELRTAFLAQKQLLINYVDEKEISSERLIEPHYLYLNYPVWYVLSWDHLRADFRTFRCDRIVHSHTTEKEFKVRSFEDFTHMLRTDSPLAL